MELSGIAGLISVIIDQLGDVSKVLNERRKDHREAVTAIQKAHTAIKQMRGQSQLYIRRENVTDAVIQETKDSLDELCQAAHATLDERNFRPKEFAQLESYLSLLEAQNYWITEHTLPRSWWVRGLDDDPTESDGAWIASASNGLLDATKDYVLHENMEEDDNSQIKDGFFTNLAIPYFDDDTIEDIPIVPEKSLVTAALEKWVVPSARKNPRIVALTWYKLVEEHDLAIFLTGDFSDPSINRLPRSEKFCMSAASVWNKILEEWLRRMKEAVS